MMKNKKRNQLISISFSLPSVWILREFQQFRQQLVNIKCNSSLPRDELPKFLQKAERNIGRLSPQTNFQDYLLVTIVKKLLPLIQQVIFSGLHSETPKLRKAKYLPNYDSCKDMSEPEDSVGNPLLWYVFEFSGKLQVNTEQLEQSLAENFSEELKIQVKKFESELGNF